MPMLFVQGSRDSLGTSEEIKPFIKNLRLPATLYAIEGGDHSFKAPKKFGKTQDEIYEGAMDEIVKWIKGAEWSKCQVRKGTLSPQRLKPLTTLSQSSQAGTGFPSQPENLGED